MHTSIAAGIASITASRLPIGGCASRIIPFVIGSIVGGYSGIPTIAVGSCTSVPGVAIGGRTSVPVSLQVVNMMFSSNTAIKQVLAASIEALQSQQAWII